MICLPIDEGLAFDMLAIRQVKVTMCPSFEGEEGVKSLKDEILRQIDSSLFYSVLGSVEYKNLYQSNLDVFSAVEYSKNGTISAVEVDYLNWVRWVHKKNLHQRFFTEAYSEQKFGYERWHYLSIENHHRLLILDEEDWKALKHYRVKMWGGYPCNGGSAIHRKVIKRMYSDRVLTKDDICDHVSGNIFDCRRSNLRLATRAQNSQNRFKPVNNRTGYKGVSLCRDGLYSVEICVNLKREHIGRWPDKIDAARAYDIVAKDRCGEFAKLNGVAMSPEQEERIRKDILAKSPRPSKTALYYGVSKRSKTTWRVDFRYKLKRHQLGSFSSAETAAKAVDDKLEELGAERRNGTQ